MVKVSCGLKLSEKGIFGLKKPKIMEIPAIIKNRAEN
jgi:hypothetical protein